MVFSLPQFQNPSFLNAIKRSIIIANNIAVSQGIKANSVVEKHTSNVVTDPNVIFDPFCTSSSKVKKAAFSNFKPPENNETKMSDIVSEHNGSLDSKSPAKIKARFDIFLSRKAEVEAELEELLCYERNENVQPATIKLREIDLKERLTSLGLDN